MTASFQVWPNSLEICKGAISEFIDYVKENEPGTRLYSSLQSEEDDTVFLHYFIFDDEVARDLHRNSAGVNKFTDTLYPELVEGVEFRTFQLFATAND
jgi:quinol monooxygenase YgiN